MKDVKLRLKKKKKKEKKKPQEKLIKQIYSWHIKSTKKQNKKLKISRGEKKIISKEATEKLRNSNNGNQRTMNCLISAKRKLLVQNSTFS